MNKRNYHKDLVKLIEGLDYRPRLLLHSCCGPCSTYVLDFLKDHFDISILFYNPNIYPEEEYFYRKEEQEALVEKMGLNIEVLPVDYRKEEFYTMAKGLEEEPENGARCLACYRLRLEEAAKVAREKGYDYFTTSLSISPHKDSQVLNQIGRTLEEKYGVKYLYSDFKKNDGFKKSVDLSKKYDMYRQDYCGCEFSMRDRKDI